MEIECLSNFGILIQTPKRVKILVGGRGSTKSTFVADYVLAEMSQGRIWCCAREYQNTIEESVHRLMLDEVRRLDFKGFTYDKSHIMHSSGGRNFYRGLARNPEGVKSMLTGIDGIWLEEGRTLSQASINVLSASIRPSAEDTGRIMRGEEVKFPELWITMNRGSSADPISKHWLKRAENGLKRHGFYEDDMLMVVEANWGDVPKKLWMATGLETERLDDLQNLPRALYDHKWGGDYLDTVDNAIIQPEWFDAAKDAHLIPHLQGAFKPYGAKIVSYDPFDDGGDAAAVAVRHGSIIEKVCSKSTGTIDDVTDWATGIARQINADWFVWDGDGMGTGLRRQISDAFKGTRTEFHMFKGSLSGNAQDNAGITYLPTDGDNSNLTPNTYADTFKNNRAQYYCELARKFHNTYNSVVKGKYTDPADMISLNTEGIDDISILRSQLCRIPRKPNPNGLEQIMSKQEMVKPPLSISSPNEADAVMMSGFMPPVKKEVVTVNVIPTLNKW